MLNIEDFVLILEDIAYPGYEIGVHGGDDAIYLQARYQEACVVTGIVEWQYTRKWRLSPHMTKSEIVQTALKCILTSAEHRVREHFRYKGQLIFGPHFDVDALVALAQQRKLDLRPNWPAPESALPFSIAPTAP